MGRTVLSCALPADTFTGTKAPGIDSRASSPVREKLPACSKRRFHRLKTATPRPSRRQKALCFKPLHRQASTLRSQYPRRASRDCRRALLPCFAMVTSHGASSMPIFNSGKMGWLDAYLLTGPYAGVVPQALSGLVHSFIDFLRGRAARHRRGNRGTPYTG